MLLRRYIAQRLQEYYAQPSGSVVGSTEQIVQFKLLLGEFHYRQKLAQLYRETGGQWLTPSEIFRPYYSAVIARYIASHVDHHRPLHVVELGGGRATNSLGVLDLFQKQYPRLYDQTQYTIMDSSPTLLELQRESLDKSRHSHKVCCCEKDMVDVAEGKTLFNSTNFQNNTQSFILGLEVLDNLPHDKLRLRNTKLEQAELESVAVENQRDDEDADRRYREVFYPLSDPLLLQLIETAPTYKRIRRAAWIPSIACGLLQSIQKELPQSQLFFADFDWLPPSDAAFSEALSSPADGQPLVTDMHDIDHACYLQPTETATDILFPTNFTKLATYAGVLFPKADVTVRKQADFLRTYGPEEVKATSSWLTGFSPLVEDYENCSVLTITNSNRSGQDIPQ